MRRSKPVLIAVCVLAWGCKKEGENLDPASKVVEQKDKSSADRPGATAGSGAPPAAIDPAQLAQRVGVEPGAIAYDKSEGSAAVIASAEGKLEVRRVGTEAWESIGKDGQLREGDQLRTPSGGKATLTLVDESAIEIAEESAIAIGSREATADPASSAAVLYGVARFTVSPRAEGEGPFLVYTPAGVVATKGTVYTAGVIASGAARVGVETGEVEVAGAASLDVPVAVGAGKVIVLTPEGTAGAVEASGDVDWGAWRDTAEAEVKVDAVAEFHSARAAALAAELEQAYAELEVQTAAAIEANAKAEAAASAGDTQAYIAVAPEIGGAVDASFALSLRLQFLSYAMLSHAYVADSLYIRHPDAAVVIEPARPQLAASVLWHKKYHAVADLSLEPIRTYYYVHHPVGRVRARAVAFEVPAFYAGVNLDYEPVAVSSRVKLVVYRPPIVQASASVKKSVWIGAPGVGWYAGVKGRVHPAPIKVAWYARPKAPRAKIILGAQAKGRLDGVFGVVAPQPRVKAGIRFKAVTGIGVRAGAGEAVHVAAPDAKVKAGLKAKVDVRAEVPPPPAVQVKVRAPAAAIGAKVKAGADAAAGAKADFKARASVKVKAPRIEPPKVKVKGSVKAKAGLKIGG